ncbi:MAG: hypothetical protein IJ149_03985 [Oscillospiraceae bacterium]|nr:hypothetical protein [Oscillospiraceae bacterium]
MNLIYNKYRICVNYPITCEKHLVKKVKNTLKNTGEYGIIVITASHVPRLLGGGGYVSVQVRSPTQWLNNPPLNGSEPTAHACLLKASFESIIGF